MNRAKKRNLITLASLVLVLALTLIVGFFVRGYRLDISNKTLRPTGILSATSIPESAQVWVNGKLKTATDQTITLSPGPYQVEIKKPGFTTWKKEITIKKEVVAETNARLFPIAPDLKALSFTGADRPKISPDNTKLVYFVTSEKENEIDEAFLTTEKGLEATTGALPEETKIGLWLINLSEKPLGHSFQPRILVKLPSDFDFDNTTINWSPDSRKIFIIVKKNETKKDYFLIDTNQAYDFTLPPLIGEKEPEAQQILADWQKQEILTFQQIFEKIPQQLQDYLATKAQNLIFSPDETKVLYQAKTDLNLPEKFLTRKIIGTSTQKESRQLKANYWYVYDHKEDKNFLVSKDEDVNLLWFPSSRHLLLIKENLSIEIIEYDGHNQTNLYSGPFKDNFVFPFPSGKQILILTSLNKNQPADLYSVSLE
jgi:hypothetical protein